MLIIDSIDHDDFEKAKKDLAVAEKMCEIGLTLGLRVVISGGYAVDGFIGQLTRSHQDVDVLIYGQENKVVELVHEVWKAIGERNTNVAIDDKGRKEFYHWYFVKGAGVGVDLYFVKTAESPFAKSYRVIKSNGDVAGAQKMNTLKYSLFEVEYEGRKPLVELNDRRAKMGSGKDEKKYQQDIDNLNWLIDLREE